ncbi:MAG: NAD(+)/NADH kinase [Euryarchaeota archaeon]|nr:NAD(+)/NADH kinase [Euryarchaeota archaeon]
MKWGIVCNPNMPRAASLAKDIYEFLKESGGDVFPQDHLEKTLETKGYSLKEINKHAEIIVTIGGDGTILFALAEIEKPIFSINTGGMGFLAEVESKYAISGLKKVIAGEYTIEERSKLKITVDGKRLPDAVNEVTVQTSQIAKMLHLQLYVESDLIETMGADGVIIATPTGSTSYALSVGGPLMDPAVSAMIIAPIAPFKLSARPWVIPLNKTVKIALLPKSKESKIVIDGQFSKEATPENDILVTGSEKKARFIRFGESFYQMVRLKLVR